MTGITSTLSITPALFPRACTPLPKKPGQWLPSRVSNTATQPRQRQRLQNYTALTQSVIARVTASAPSTAEAPTAGQRRLCPFTSLPLGADGRFSAADSVAHIKGQPCRVQFGSARAKVDIRAIAADPAAVSRRPPRTLHAVGTPMSSSGVPRRAADAVPLAAPAKTQPSNASPRPEVPGFLLRIARIRNMWQSGMFAETAPPVSSSSAAVQRIQAEIAAARSASL